MASPELIEYVKVELSKGLQEEAIKKQLLSQSISENEIEQAFSQVRSEVIQTPQTNPQSGTSTNPAGQYPTFIVSRNVKPIRMFAFPYLGGFVKVFSLFPQALMLLWASLVLTILLFINAFAVLFTGKYFRPAHNWVVKYANMYIAMQLFFWGVSDTYPGFSYIQNAEWKLEIPYPTKPGRLYSVPLLGFVIRLILMIPFLLFTYIIAESSMVISIATSIPVFFKRYYPESSYELLTDNMRLFLRVFLYFTGVSETYPSFKISMRHKAIKIIFILIGLGIVIFGLKDDIQNYRKPQTEKVTNHFSAPYHLR